VSQTDACFSSDLGTFASHAGRKVIEEGDVQMLLQRYYPPLCFRLAKYGRQRLIKMAGGGAKMSVFSVAQRYLPGELLGRVRMVKPVKRKTRTRRVHQTEEA
jgi:Centromere kinetochore component CENP-T histone fold